MRRNAYFTYKDKQVSNQTESFYVFVFQPDQDFYALDFATKLEILEKKIIMANTYLKEKNTKAKGIFVAPEYLFKDFSHDQAESYYNHSQKLDYLKTLLALSFETNLIIAAGTLCWKKPNKSDGEFYYRNMIYVIHRGIINKYKKYNPYPPQDFNFASDPNNYKSTKFFRRGNLNNVVEIDGLFIGIEICFDNFKNSLNASPKMDLVNVHIIVADGLENENFLKKSNLLTIKVEKRPEEYKTIVANQITENDAIASKPPSSSTTIASDLVCHRFDNIDFKKEESSAQFLNKQST